jgi:nucleoside-diphosphate-sugar epimerase
MGSVTKAGDHSSRVLITGGSGFIGSHVITKGLNLNREIIAVTHQRDIAEKNVKAFNCDLQDAEMVRDMIEEVNPGAIIHLASSGVAYGTGGMQSMMDLNFRGLNNIFDSLIRMKLNLPVILTGSGFEYKPQSRPIKETDAIMPNSGYGVTKAAASLLAAFYSGQIPVTILRLFSLYGPGEKEPRIVPYIINQAKNNMPIDLTLCEQIRDYTYVGDVAELVWHLLELPLASKKLNIFNVGTGKLITLKKFTSALAAGLKLRGYSPEMNYGGKPYRADEIMFYAPNVNLLKRKTGRLPATGISAGINKTLEYFL